MPNEIWAILFKFYHIEGVYGKLVKQRVANVIKKTRNILNS